MSWEIIFVLCVLFFTVVSFAREKLPIDVTATTAFAVLLLCSSLITSDKLPSLDSLIGVFANPAPLTIAAMFIMSAALNKCGVIELMATWLEKLTKLTYPLFITVLVIGVGGVSAFVNNTPVVVVFMPVVMSLARKMNTPASKLLIPLSYASIFGGVCTLMGTSTNILISGIMVKYEMPALGMFELFKVGFPLLLLGTTYLMLFGRKLLPVRETLTAILSEEERKEYITEAYVKTGSVLAGHSWEDSDFKKTRGIRLLEIIRDGVALSSGRLTKETLEAGDRLVMACHANAIASARKTEGIDFVGDRGLELEPISAHEGAIVEGVIGPMSTITGKTIHEINFRQRYRMVILAVHRQGRNVREKLETLPLEFGDTLLMMGTDKAIENIRNSEDILLLDRPTHPSHDIQGKTPIVVGTIAAMVLAISFNLIPIFAAAIIAVAVLFLTDCVKPKDAYNAIEWRILILIYGMLALGQAMEASGATTLAAEGLLLASSLGSETVRPYIMIAIVYFATNIMTEMLSNNATVVLMAPIAIGIANALGIDPRPLLIAVCVASSASFSTPIGYQTNTYVYSVGGYRFSDFFKIGIPLNLIYFTVSVFLIPIIWKF